MMTGGPRPGCAAAAHGPGCGRQAGRQVLGGGVAEKAAASLGMGGEYSHILPRTLPGYRKTWRRVLWNPGRKLSGAYSWLSKFQVFIGLALNGSCVILKIGKQYDHDDGGAFDALQEEKGRPEGLLKHGRHVAGPGHTRRLPQNGGLAQMARAVVSQVRILDLPPFIQRITMDLVPIKNLGGLQRSAVFHFGRGGGVDAEGTEEYLEAQVRHRRSA